MATFFVGQRVRKVLSPSYARKGVPVGSEGVVVEVKLTKAGTKLKGGSRLVEDNDLVVAYSGVEYLEVSSYVEPILPEGHTPSVYSFEELMDKCREGVAA